MRAHPILALLASVCATTCADLRVFIADGSCGNEILEGSEDCDTHEEWPNTTCEAPGRAHECRYVCMTGEDCPPGWGCGRDGVCREPAGTFTRNASYSQTFTYYTTFDAADYDGDGIDDLIVHSGSALSILFFGESGEVAEETTMTIDTSAMPPAIRDLDHDGRADLVISTFRGVLRFYGRTDRLLLPRLEVLEELETSEVLDSPELGPPVFAMRDPSRLGARLVTFEKTGDAISASLFAERTEAGSVPYVGGFQWQSSLGNVDDRRSGAAEELLVTGDDHASVYGLTCLDPPLKSCRLVEARNPIRFDASLDRAPLVADLDADGFPDLILPSLGETRVAYGGRGLDFCATPWVGEECSEFGRALPDPRFLETPRFFGDFDTDGHVDYLDESDTLHRAVTTTTTNAIVRFEQTGWIPDDDNSDSVVADFNGDGRLDVARASMLGFAVDGLDIFLGSEEGPFSRVHIAVPREPSGLWTGDFDGDRLPDLAMSEGERELWILYGDLAIGREPAKLVASLPNIANVSTGLFANADGRLAYELRSGQEDRQADIAIVSIADVGRYSLVLLAGTPQRAMIPVAKLPATNDPPGGYRSIAQVLLGSFMAANQTDLLVLTVDRERPPPAGEIANDTLELYVYRGDGSFTRLESACAEPLPINSAITPYDTNGDGTSELIAIAHHPPNPLVITVDGATSSFTCTRLTLGESLRDRPALVADLDGDAKDDLMFELADELVTFFGSLDEAQVRSPLHESPAARLVPIQVDADPEVELILVGNTAVGLYERGSYVGEIDSIERSVGVNTSISVAGDFNGDGVTDLVVFDNGTFSFYAQNAKVRSSSAAR